MNEEYAVLTEKEEMWARMLQDVLHDNGIPCILQPVYGAGYSIRTGKQDRMRVLIPDPFRESAENLMQELFPDGPADEKTEE